MLKFLPPFVLICSVVYAGDFDRCSPVNLHAPYVGNAFGIGDMEFKYVKRIGFYRELDTIEEITPRTQYGVQVDFYSTKKGDKCSYKRVRSATLRVPAIKDTSPLGDAMLNLDTAIMKKNEDIVFKYPIYTMSFEIPWELEESPDGELLTCLLKAWVCDPDNWGPNYSYDGTTYRKMGK